ncbi:MAG: MBL fold metallo-hydrolase [Flavobacteriales bacterium]|nr:MBL fold metallo-hydrolase [Flavobacteriales bacterium]
MSESFKIILFLTTCFIHGCTFRPIPKQLYSKTLVPDTSAGLRVQFLGNTNILIDDGETRILTDGFFSRPGGLKVLLGKIQPKKSRIEQGLQNADILELDAIIPVHSHYDHVMDAPVVAQLTGGKLIGSTSTLMVGRGLGLKEDQMIEAPLDTIIKLGKFTLRFYASKHWGFPREKMRRELLDQPITAPLVPPVKANEYKEGISYTIIIEHEKTSFAIHGSAGFKENYLDKDLDVDILFLSVAGIEVKDSNYVQGYQQHVVEALNPEVIIPIHWDDFTTQLDKGIKTNHRVFNSLTGFDVQRAIDIVESNNANRKIAFLSLWEKYNVQALLK